MKLFRLLTLSTLLVLLAFPVLSLAQKEPGDPVPTPSPQGGTPVAPEAVPQTRTDDGFISLTQIRGLEEAGESSNFAVLFNNLYLLCVGAGAILAVLQVLRGGLTYMLSDSITNKKEARDTIVMALVGLLLVLSPTIVFGIIDPRILSLQVNFSGIRPQTQYDSLPDMCRQYSNIHTYAPPNTHTNQTPSCSQEHSEVFDIPRACCGSGLREGTLCCGSSGGPGVPPPPGSPAWCETQPPIPDGTPITNEGQRGCCYGQPFCTVLGSATGETCECQVPTELYGCHLIGTGSAQVTEEQCTAAGCTLQGSGSDRMCSCAGSAGQSTPTCTRMPNAQAVQCTDQPGCVYDSWGGGDGVCACSGG